MYFVQGVTAAAPKGCQQQQYRSNDRALRTHAGSAVNFPRLGLRECFTVTYVTLATSMGGWGMAIGGVTYVTRNIYGGGVHARTCKVTCIV